MKPPSKAKSNTDLVSLQGLIGIGSALGGLLGGGSGSDSTPSGTVVNTYIQPTPITDAQEAAFEEGHFGVDYSSL
jgi:hypothetical protein